jgi:hypothetical protein
LRTFENQPWLWYGIDYQIQTIQNQGLTMTNVAEESIGREIRQTLKIDGDAERGHID